MLKKRIITDYEIIKGCAEYLQISEADMVNNEYMREHPDVLDILVNVAIKCKKKYFRENIIIHRQVVVHSFGCNDIDYMSLRKAEERTRVKIQKDQDFKKQISEIADFIGKKDYMTSDFEVINSKIVGYHGNEKYVVIPAGLLLGKRAFSDCATIESVKLNKEIKVIPQSTFSNCKSLTKIYGLEQIEQVDSNAFFCCESLSEIELPFGIERIESHVFYGCTSLKEVTIPSSVVEIGYAAFQDCKSLKTVQLPEGLKEIHLEAFMCCDSLKKIEIPESVERIDDAAFEFCGNLKCVSLPQTAYVGRNAFSHTPWETEQAKGGAFITNGILHKVDEELEEYDIPEDVNTIAMAAFSKSNIRKIIITKNVRYIAAYAFESSKIAEIHFECKECEFEHSVFSCCENIKEIILPQCMKRIYPNTFGDVGAIIEIPEAVEQIAYDAFEPTSLAKPTGMKPKIRAKENTLGAEFAKEHGIELILK